MACPVQLQSKIIQISQSSMATDMRQDAAFMLLSFATHLRIQHERIKIRLNMTVTVEKQKLDDINTIGSYEIDVLCVCLSPLKTAN